MKGSAVVNSSCDVELVVKVDAVRRRLRRRRQRLLVNVVDIDANVEAWNSVNTHHFDVWCFCESSRTFDPAVGLGTTISGVELPPNELRKVVHIPPSPQICRFLNHTHVHLLMSR